MANAYVETGNPNIGIIPGLTEIPGYDRDPGISTGSRLNPGIKNEFEKVRNFTGIRLG